MLEDIIKEAANIVITTGTGLGQELPSQTQIPTGKSLSLPIINRISTFHNHYMRGSDRLDFGLNI